MSIHELLRIFLDGSLRQCGLRRHRNAAFTVKLGETCTTHDFTTALQQSRCYYWSKKCFENIRNHADVTTANLHADMATAPSHADVTTAKPKMLTWRQPSSNSSHIDIIVARVLLKVVRRSRQAALTAKVRLERIPARLSAMYCVGAHGSFYFLFGSYKEKSECLPRAIPTTEWILKPAS